MILALAALAAPAAAKPSPMCKPLQAIADAVASSGQVRRITFFKLVPMETACGSTSDPVIAAYCHVAMEESGIEFSHRYPRLVLACLKEDGLHPLVEWRKEYTGFSDGQKLVHLSGHLRNGVWLDVRWTRASDDLDGYYGQYEMTIWVQP